MDKGVQPCQCIKHRALAVVNKYLTATLQASFCCDLSGEVNASTQQAVTVGTPTSCSPHPVGHRADHEGQIRQPVQGVSSRRGSLHPAMGTCPRAVWFGRQKIGVRDVAASRGVVCSLLGLQQATRNVRRFSGPGLPRGATCCIPSHPLGVITHKLS
jgi:hypothetical protein